MTSGPHHAVRRSGAAIPGCAPSIGRRLAGVLDQLIVIPAAATLGLHNLMLMKIIPYDNPEVFSEHFERASEAHPWHPYKG